MPRQAENRRSGIFHRRNSRGYPSKGQLTEEHILMQEKYGILRNAVCKLPDKFMQQVQGIYIVIVIRMVWMTCS